MISIDEYDKQSIDNFELFLSDRISADEFHDNYFRLRKVKIDPNSKRTKPIPEKAWIINSIFGLVECYCPSEFEASEDDFTAEQLRKGIEIAWRCKDDDELVSEFVKAGLYHLPE